MYNSYSIEGFINYLNEDDDYAYEGMIENIKSIFKRFYNWITKTVPMMIKSFLDKHPKLRNLPIVKQLYSKLKNYEKKLRQMERNGGLNKDAKSVLNQLNKMREDVSEDVEELKKSSYGMDSEDGRWMRSIGVDPKKYYTNTSIEKGIAENNVTRIKLSIGTICYTIDFINGNFEKAVRYVEEVHGIKLKEKFNNEFPLVYSGEKKDYTGEDLGLAVFYLQENFCDERINDIKKIRVKIDRKNDEMDRKEEEEKRRRK